MGPFHFFFTLSAAEMRWPSVSTAILHYEQKIDKIVYEPGWEENEENIMIYFNDAKENEEKVKSLPEYKKKYVNHKFYKDHFLLITRIFNNRVKAFINNTLIANEHVEHYSYRIGKKTFLS